MKYKLIVSDLDDTLLNDELLVSDKNKRSIADYIAAGGVFTVATGRMTKPMLDICKDLNLTGEAISYQGAVITDTSSGATVEEIGIPTAVASEVCRYLDKLNVYYQVYEGSEIHIKRLTHWSELYKKFCDCPFIEHGDNLLEYIKDKGLALVKIMLMEDPAYIEGHIRELTGVFGEELLVNTSKKWLIEMVNKKINKGTAVAGIAGRLGILREEVICIGDSSNDLSMIEYAGLGVAVRNGDPKLKQLADYVCPSNNEDGVAHVIYKFGLERAL